MKKMTFLLVLLTTLGFSISVLAQDNIVPKEEAEKTLELQLTKDQLKLVADGAKELALTDDQVKKIKDAVATYFGGSFAEMPTKITVQDGKVGADGVIVLLPKEAVDWEARGFGFVTFPSGPAKGAVVPPPK